MSLKYKKITVKVGSNVLTKDDGTLNVARIAHLVDQIATLRKKGVEVILVSSGAVAAGRGELQPVKKLDTISSRQLWSAIGQVKLINRYADFFREYGISCAQVLATKEGFSNRRGYLNMKNCITTLLENRVIPIVNENDTVSVTELMFTDNDELSGLIASMMNSEALILLTNVDGIYKKGHENDDLEIISEINENFIENIVNISRKKSNFGRGGMITKYSIARKVALHGVKVHIANGLRNDILINLVENEQVANTAFIFKGKKSSDIKKWIAHSDSFAKGEVIVNEGAKRALESEKATSLLLIGINRIKGSFKKGDIVKIIDEKGSLVGLGKSQYHAEKATRLLGKKNRKPFVHYDYLYLNE